MPMPYLVAHLLGELDASGLPLPAPYTRNRREEGKLVHYVDVVQPLKILETELKRSEDF